MGTYKLKAACSVNGKVYKRNAVVELSDDAVKALGPDFLIKVADKQVKEASAKDAGEDAPKSKSSKK